jgi:signal transduction histidine kinase
MFGWGGVALVGIFGLSALACLLVAARERRRQGGLGRSFAGFLALTGVWAAVEAVRIGIGGLGPKRALYTVGLVLGLTTVVAWLRFCAEFAGRRPGRTVWGVVWTVWAAGVAVKLTNPLHGRYFAAQMRSTPFEHMAVQPGALHWVVTALAYVGAFAGLYVVAESVVASRNARGRLTAGAVLLVGPVVPSLLSLLVDGYGFALFFEPVGVAGLGLALTVGLDDDRLLVRGPARRQLATRLDRPVIVLDTADRVVDHNGVAAALFPRLAGTEGPLETVAPTLATAAAGDAAADRTVTVERGGRARHFLVRREPVTLGSRRVGHTLVLADVTELERRRRELDRQNEHLDAIAESLAHELRNPLNVVLGRLDEATDARRAGERMSEMIDELTALAELGKTVEAPTDHDLAAVVAEADATVEGLGLSTAAGGRLVADRDRLVALLRRTALFAAARGASQARVRLAGDRLTVATDADALEPDAADRALAYGHPTPGPAGPRLGLAAVRTLAGAHGWTADLDRSTADLTLVVTGVDRADPSDADGSDPDASLGPDTDTDAGPDLGPDGGPDAGVGPGSASG